MTTSDTRPDDAAATVVDVDALDRAAQAIAAADAKNWSHSEVRNRYRGVALSAVSAYLRAPATTDVDQEEPS